MKLTGQCKNPSSWSSPDQPSFHPAVLGFLDAGRFKVLAGRLRAAGFFIALLDDFPISPNRKWVMMGLEYVQGNLSLEDLGLSKYN